MAHGYRPARAPTRGPTRRVTRGLAVAALIVVLIYFLKQTFFYSSNIEFNYVPLPIRPERYPVPLSKKLHLPRRRPAKIPKIQHAPVAESPKEKELRVARLNEVRDTFLHAWNGYKKEAWAQDELRPISGGYKTPFCGWAATLVDSLDTLWIMGLHEEFELALAELPKIDFTGKEGCVINLFETTIRHLGGLLSTFDISGGKYTVLVEKAVELAEVLFSAFDTPNRMPTPHYMWSATNPEAHDHMPSRAVVVAVLGSLSLEFTRLSQITGNDKYFDGVQRVINELEKWQSKTQLPGMWPAMVDSTKEIHLLPEGGFLYNGSAALSSPFEGSDELFTLGALADSTYEYLPKQFMMLGGQSRQYRTMYEDFIEVAKKYLFFRPMTVGDHDILISGTVNRAGDNELRHNANLEHLTCFTGGMLAIAGKIFDRPGDLEDGKKLADGCVWAYRSTITGIMPETFSAVPCKSRDVCKWDEALWFAAIDENADPAAVKERIRMEQLSPGFTHVQDKRYLLRPEAIESVFILWRITHDKYWTDSGWDMFKAIQAHTTTSLAHSAINDVLSGSPRKVDEMESFWLAETLKYFYLLYSEPDVISLDEYVLNTEAHPLKRPR